MLNRILDQLAALTSADRVRTEERQRAELHPSVERSEPPKVELNALARVSRLRDKLNL